MVAAWPTPVRELLLVGHSLGGLVMRSACAAGDAARHSWRQRLKSMVFLGTPHQGAPLERGGHGVDRLFGASPYTVAFARLGQLRSAGITDLRHGALLDADWQGRDRFARDGYRRHVLPLPRGVRAFAIAGSASKAPPAGGRAPRGDGLVPVASALGAHAELERDLGLPATRRWIAYGTGHLDLLGSPAVYAQMLAWLSGSADDRSCRAAVRHHRDRGREAGLGPAANAQGARACFVFAHGAGAGMHHAFMTAFAR